jgi:hypothetical protein
MASSFKTLNPEDISVVRTPLYEVVPITGSLISGSYSGANVKTYTHEMFETVYDYPYLSASANQLVDITFGVSPLSSGTLSSEYDAAYVNKKRNIYTQMAQVLNGYDTNNAVKSFNSGLTSVSISSWDHMYFLNFSRLLAKDEIRKGQFQLQIQTGSNPTDYILISDEGNLSNYQTTSPTGDWGYLKVQTGGTGPATGSAGAIFYQAGVVGLSTNVFAKYMVGQEELNTAHPEYLKANNKGVCYGSVSFNGSSIQEIITGSSIEQACDALRSKIINVQFHNTTEINSTVYFCRANASEFNYSSNPTFLSGSKIVVKDIENDSSVTYITTVGLYGDDNELLAVAKLSEPIKKTQDQSLTFRVRLDT